MSATCPKYTVLLINFKPGHLMHDFQSATPMVEVRFMQIGSHVYEKSMLSHTDFVQHQATSTFPTEKGQSLTGLQQVILSRKRKQVMKTVTLQ